VATQARRRAEGSRLRYRPQQSGQRMSTDGGALVYPATSYLTVAGVGEVVMPAADRRRRRARRPPLCRALHRADSNANTRAAYTRAAGRFFAWCEAIGVGLPAIARVHVAAYVEALMQERAAPTVKQHLAAIRELFDWPGSSSARSSPPTSLPVSGGRRTR